VTQKDELRNARSKSDPASQAAYQVILQDHRQILENCRAQHWPEREAMWLRLYPCDLRSGALDQIFDRIVNLGYNEVFVEAFYDGRVLLPASENSTPWPSVVSNSGYEDADLLAQAIAVGQARGLKVYAWMFTMNFGYSYAQRSDRQGTLAQNGRGQTSLDLLPNDSQVFIDPYNLQAQLDYNNLVQQVLKRQPDGVLFDYIRYPRGTGPASVVTKVQDLLIYGDASRQSFLGRATNNKGREAIARFLRQGYISTGDITQINQLYPQEPQPLWQGRTVNGQDKANPSTAALQQPQLQQELWFLSVAHAQRGILDFLNMAIAPAQAANISTGAVFFPGGNELVGTAGFDSRLQPWQNFPTSIQWHPMAYATCNHASCIVAEVQKVLSQAPQTAYVQPALAGMWGAATQDRPSLETQMDALRVSFGDAARSSVPQLKAVSHFAYSWQYPQDDNQRKFCRL
jgi:hypothetical protein